MKKIALLALLTLIASTLSFGAFSAEDLSMTALTLSTNADGSQEYSVTLQILIFMKVNTIYRHKKMMLYKKYLNLLVFLF